MFFTATYLVFPLGFVSHCAAGAEATKWIHFGRNQPADAMYLQTQMHLMLSDKALQTTGPAYPL